ncbi:hypothetical protein OZX56_05145 [Lactobacillus sp. ESL0684]|uniref:hypothetical protein n=1 Tax=Lactobacillus sp. ESL0684 TaxID=2983213 RepID=UPI0023F67DBF|nr:hypothetical protein [Lactobacillus sp. ESL0684]WEV42935.1 hypothetical protein OZX56_05145 [Lactobacillus sp. ESL0684]
MTDTNDSKTMEFKGDILNIPDDTNYWFVRAGSGAIYYDDFYINNYIGEDSNGLNLYNLYSIPTSLKSANSAILERYKTLFREHDLKLFDERNKDQEKNVEVLHQEKVTETRRSTKRANRVFLFVEQMKIGDFIFVPSNHSSEFLVGIIVSDCFDGYIKHTKLLDIDEDTDDEYGYKISPYEFKRKIYWIKELSENEFPNELAGYRNVHQSITNITDSSDLLNPCISSQYFYKNNYYIRIGVNTTEKISSLDWLTFQNLIKDIVGEKKLNNIFQKQKVQSPGLIILFGGGVALLFVIIGILFGTTEVDIKTKHVSVKTTTKDLLSYFTNKDIEKEMKEQELEQKK